MSLYHLHICYLVFSFNVFNVSKDEFVDLFNSFSSHNIRLSSVLGTVTLSLSPLSPPLAPCCTTSVIDSSFAIPFLAMTLPMIRLTTSYRIPQETKMITIYIRELVDRKISNSSSKYFVICIDYIEKINVKYNSFLYSNIILTRCGEP